jgi:uncharacterized protein (TIGR02246 family)
MTTEFQSEQAAQDLLLKLRDAWDRGDGEAYASVFSEDAQYVNAPGERVYGRKAIAESHQHVFNTIFKGSKLGRNYPRRFRHIAPDVILVESSGAVLFPGESEDRIPPNGHLTMVIARQNDAWRIVSFQNTPTGRMRKVKFISRYLRSRFSRS